MKHIHCPEVEGLDSRALGLEGSANMTVKRLSQNSVCIVIEPGGHTPNHAHDDKERIVVISGKGEIVLDEGRKDIKHEDFVEFDAKERHQILNNGSDALTFMCFRNQK
jgi:quercetin dioxygenase-like cupin family protein